MAGLILEMARDGAGEARERHERLALGRLLESLDRLDEAERCFVAAATDNGVQEREPDRAARAEALNWLALHRRRAHRFQEAAEAWLALSEIDGVDTELRREALEALAIHHEHRVKNLEAADRSLSRRFAWPAMPGASRTCSTGSGGSPTSWTGVRARPEIRTPLPAPDPDNRPAPTASS